MENSSKKILCMRMVNKLETNNISNNMEFAGFTKAMEEIKQLKLDVVEIVTDSHTQITSELSKLSVFIYWVSE